MKKILFFCIVFFWINANANELSPEARSHFLKGIQAIESANFPRDYMIAEEEFQKVIEYSPNWAEGYYNLALVSEALGKEVKAIKNYKKYLSYISDDKEKIEVEKKIRKLTEIKQTKKRIGLSGVSLISLKDGIYILNLVDGSKLKQVGFMAGDKIIEINKRPVVNMSLGDFYELIERSNEHPLLQKRIDAFGRNVGMESPVAITIVRGNNKQILMCPLSTFKTSLYEIEEDELEEEVYRAELPTAVITWLNWCSFCKRQIPVVERLAEKYSGKIRFVTINLEINKKFSKEFNIRSAPVTLLFKKDKIVDILMGFKDETTYEEWLINAITKNTPIYMHNATKTSNFIEKENCEKKMVRVVQVIKNSLAWKAGFRPDDIILSIDGKKVIGVDEYFRLVLQNLSPGEHKIEVLREKEKILLILDIPNQKNLGLGLILKNECDISNTK